MYAQYQYYQQPSNSHVVSSTSSLPSSQQGMSWNGTSWVSSNRVENSTYSTYEKPSVCVSANGTFNNNSASIPQQQAAAESGSSCSPALNPIVTYTEYYHKWKAYESECETYMQRLLATTTSTTTNSNTERQEIQSRIDWAKYYADLSSRAAHYFYQNPNSTCAPFDLPPCPPSSTSSSSLSSAAAAPASTSNVNSASATGSSSYNYSASSSRMEQEGSGSHNLPNTSVSSSSFSENKSQNDNDKHTPGSLTRYVQKCLDRCSTPEQRQAVQAQVETTIAQAIQEGNLHTRNWDSVPLIPVPGQHQPISITLRSNTQHQHHPHSKKPSSPQNSTTSHTSSTSSHSPGIPGGGPKKHKQSQQQHQQLNGKKRYAAGYDAKLPVNDSYYGRSSSGSGDDSQVSKHLKPAASQTQKNGYYGPASTASTSYYSSSTHPFSGDHGDNKKDISSLLSSQDRSIADDDFISLSSASSRQPKKKKQKKATQSSNKEDLSPSAMGFEKSHHVLAKRAHRFAGRGGIVDASNIVLAVHGHDKYMGKSTIGGGPQLDEQDFEKMTVKGTCHTLEKEYLRLTAPPRAELVRPQPVLERHLENLKKEYYEDYGNGSCSQPKPNRRDYLWFCSQLKAVRQDCTVQRIQNAFGIDVYETHARIALHEGDLNEYNQCQTQLKELYEKNKHLAADGKTLQTQPEFTAYRLLYYVFLSTNEKYDGGSSDMFKIMLSLTSEQRQCPAIAHALQVREAVALGDYLQFFRLHQASPNLGRYLTERIVPTMRMRALRRMAMAYRPSLDLKVCLCHLGFSLDDDAKESSSALEEGKDWLVRCGCVIEGSNIMMKDSVIHEPSEDKKNSLI